MLTNVGVSSRLELPHETGLLGEHGGPADALIVHRGLRRHVLVLSELEHVVGGVATGIARASVFTTAANSRRF